MRLLVGMLLVAGCQRTEPPLERWSEAWLAQEATRYLDDPAARREALDASLTNHANIYSSQRLESYGLGTRGWDALPEWNPRSRRVDAAAVAELARGTWPELPTERVWDGQRPTTQAGWVALGERVFFQYPLRAEVAFEHVMIGAPETPADVRAAAALGIDITAAGEVLGAVTFNDVDGTQRVGITCAVCHSSVQGAATVAGAARRRFDLGALRLAYYRDSGETVDPELARRMATWGPGRADVTEDDDEDPVAIPDLWSLREQAYLTQAGTIRHVGPLALALRQETQLLHANALRVRPPRELAWALAMYIYSLAPPPSTHTSDPQLVARGRMLFDRRCTECHANASGGGDLVPAAAVGTNPALANGKARGTGFYRVPVLTRVSAAAPYFHDGTVPTLAALFEPARSAPGHMFGTDLPPADRAALVGYLESL